jgi:hypothetical protein
LQLVAVAAPVIQIARMQRLVDTPLEWVDRGCQRLRPPTPLLAILTAAASLFVIGGLILGHPGITQRRIYRIHHSDKFEEQRGRKAES